MFKKTKNIRGLIKLGAMCCGHCKWYPYPYRVEHHIYDKASHALTDGLDELSGYAKWAFKNMLPAEKKYPRECEGARQDSFRRILAFLEGWN